MGGVARVPRVLLGMDDEGPSLEDAAPGHLCALLLGTSSVSSALKAPSHEEHLNSPVPSRSPSPLACEEDEPRWGSRSRSRSGHRAGEQDEPPECSRSPSPVPMPKRMPKAKKMPKAARSAVQAAKPKLAQRPKAINSPPPAKASYTQALSALQARPKVLPKAAVQPRARGSAGLAPPRLPPGGSSSSSSSSGSSGADERWAMAVLARHSARLGIAGCRLEVAIRAAVKDKDPRGCWSFMQFRPCGPLTFQHYQRERRRFLAIYDRMGRVPAADLQVREILASERGQADEATLWVPPPELRAAEPASYRKPPKLPPQPATWQANGKPKQLPGGYMELPVEDVRFAHDDQSEFFGRMTDRCSQNGESLLLLAIELLTGLTSAQDVPEFNVCFHKGHWYCRSGNRRLGALRLVSGFLPDYFKRVRVKVVNADTIFTQGAPGKRAKLTTHRNGADCEGQWMFIKETGEPIGHRGGHDSDEYGADLLSLLTCVAVGSS